MHTTSHSESSKQGKGENIAPVPKRTGWMPKCRAATLGDRRTKRNRTRGDRNRRAIAENS